MSYRVMKQKYHLISSIISMTLTSVLLVFVCLAWYVSNKQATSSGIIASVVEKNDLIDSVEYFEATTKSDSTFTFTKLTNNDRINEVFEMGTYNPLLSDALPQRLMVINLKKEFTVSVEARTKATAYLAETVKIGDEFVMTKEGPNSLTSVIGLYLLSNVLENNDGTLSAIIDSTSEKYFADPNEDTITKSVELGSVTSNKVFILLDYYEESIEHIYSENLGNPALDPIGEATDENPHLNDIKYTCDFYFTIREGA